jgi:hypothetical protein
LASEPNRVVPDSGLPGRGVNAASVGLWTMPRGEILNSSRLTKLLSIFSISSAEKMAWTDRTFLKSVKGIVDYLGTFGLAESRVQAPGKKPPNPSGSKPPRLAASACPSVSAGAVFSRSESDRFLVGNLSAMEHQGFRYEVLPIKHPSG